MGSQSWLTLLEYSSKYGVSISTLRRRIKAGELEFQFDDGKYLIMDNSPAPSGAEVIAPPTLMKPQIQRTPEPSPPLKKNLKLAPPLVPATAEPQGERMEMPASHPVATQVVKEISPLAENLLVELKKAYTQILQEKEEQILLLRSEVSDLKTLVGVLEEQNGQLKMTVEPKFELDLEL